MKLLRRHLPELVALLVVSLAAFLSSRAMFHEGFFRTIDDVTTVRIDHLTRELRRGFWLENFPVRLGGELAHRYGYFFYLFYAPLVYYAGALLMIFGNLSDIMATKAVYAFPLLLGPFFFYFAARQKLGRLGSAVGGFLFGLFHYRGFDAYTRGGVAENWAMAFLPALFAGIFLLEKKSRFGAPLVSVFLGLIIISHNVAAITIIPLVILYGLFFLPRRRDFWLALVLGLGLSAFFWLPMLYYLPLIKANADPLNTTFVLSTLLPLRDIIAPNLITLFDQKYIPAFFYLSLIGSGYFLLRPGHNRGPGLFWSAVSLVLYLLLADTFLFLWQLTLPVTRTLQFAWRIFIPLSLTLPLTVGYLLSALKSRFVKAGLAVFILLLSLTYLPSFKPKEYSYFYSYSADDSSHCGTASFDEYFPSWVGQCVNQTQLRPYFLTQPGDLVVDRDQVLQLTAHYTSPIDNTLMIHKYYFPGWELLVDGRAMPIEYRSTVSGIMVASVPAGSHAVELSFRKTLVMWAADLVTLVSLITVVSLMIIRRRSPRPTRYHA